MMNVVKWMTTKLKGYQGDPFDPVEEYCKKGHKANIVISNVLQVTDFSSQYGSEASISYTAKNLAGQGSIFPAYGDFTQACLFRTYGHWWDVAPSGRKPLKSTPSSFCSQDFIELSFQKKVYPLKLEIFETYNPGCVVKILACEKSDDTDVDTGNTPTKWTVLWQGEPVKAASQSRIFCPLLKKCHFPTDTIRLELCHKLVHYYTELDYVVLYGSMVPDESKEQPLMDTDHILPGCSDHETSLIMATEHFQILLLDHTCSPKDNAHVLQQMAESQQWVEPVIDFHDRMHDGTLSETCNWEIVQSDNGYFDSLPEEVIQLILSKLAMVDLCRLAQTCRLLHTNCYDALQYTELDLQPYWPQVNDMALGSLQKRSQCIQKLNLSWCHRSLLSETAFIRYMQVCGDSLRCLYLSSCNFVTKEGLQAIVESCPNLTELDLDSCQLIDSEGFYDVHKLVHLERLILYRTQINQNALHQIIRSCTELHHLNIGSTTHMFTVDEILKDLGKHTRHLKSLDLWRCRSLSHVGILALASGCLELEELDIGWCADVKSSTECITALVHSCRKLKKLFLTANRTVCDSDLNAIAEYSSDLQQLDILGTRQVSADAAQRVLERCKHLVLFDVSYCSGIDNYIVEQWHDLYPNVDIKKSFQS